MKKILIVAVAVLGGVLAPAAAHAATKPRPPVIAPCPSWAPDTCKPVVVHAPPLPRWLSKY